MQEKNEKDNIEHWIAKSFDNDPEIRKQSALVLSKSDDPGALLALLELAGDKNKEVAEIAKKALDEKKKKDPVIRPLTEVFEGVDFSGSKEQPKEDQNKERIRKKVLAPIENIIKRKFGEEKGEKVKLKLLPMIFKSISQEKRSSIINENVIKTYLEAISLNNNELDNEKKKGIIQKELDIGIVSSQQADSNPITKEFEELENMDLLNEEEKKLIKENESSLFKLSYDIMLAVGDNKKELEKQYKKLKEYADYQISLAYKLAKKRFKETKITRINEIKDGMRSITTDLLKVIDIKQETYKRTKTKEDTYTRIVVSDKEGNKGVIYIFDDRAKFIKPGMSIKIIKGIVKTFKFSGETVITITKRGKIIAEF